MKWKALYVRGPSVSGLAGDQPSRLVIAEAYRRWRRSFRYTVLRPGRAWVETGLGSGPFPNSTHVLWVSEEDC